jgi:hypothetical protein
MPALLDLVPATKITDPDWEQPLESIVDVSGYTEAALMMNLINMVCGTEGTTTINIQTAIENRDEQYVTIASTSYTSAPSMPTNVYIYLKGSTSGSSRSAPLAWL